ncbi:MAG: acyloxyacyl hydrolase, partial [Bacteroidota bacterium]
MHLLVFANEPDSLKNNKNRFPKSIGFYYQPGSVIRSHDFVQGENPNHEPYGIYHVISAKYGIHTTGKELWQQLYVNPVYGVGLYTCFFLNDHGEMGNPYAVYSFIDLPLKSWYKWILNWEMEFGLAFNWKRHYLRENNYYYPIGSYSTVFLDAGLNITGQLGKYFDLIAAITYTHFSNGAVRLPNLGVNMVGARVELRYIFSERPVFQVQEIPKYKKEWEFIVLLVPSMRQVGFTYINQTADTVAKAFNYGIISLSTTFNRQISYKIKFGAGADISYNAAFGADTVMVNGVPEKASFNALDKILVGVYPSFELVLGRLSIIAQPGFYIYRKVVGGYETPVTYQRIGAKYHFWNHLVLGVNIRAFNF